MTDGLLENIIQLEKRIQTDVATERERVALWQQRELAVVEESFDAALVAEEARSSQKLAVESSALQAEGAALEAAAETWCQRLSDLDDETLRDVLMRHLAVILPGGDHDHPHGQSRNRRPQTGPSECS